MKPLPKTIFQGKNCKTFQSLTTGPQQAFLLINVKMSKCQNFNVNFQTSWWKIVCVPQPYVHKTFLVLFWSYFNNLGIFFVCKHPANTFTHLDISECCSLLSWYQGQGSPRPLVQAGDIHTSASTPESQAHMLCCTQPRAPIHTICHYQLKLNDVY